MPTRQDKSAAKMRAGIGVDNWKLPVFRLRHGCSCSRCMEEAADTLESLSTRIKELEEENARLNELLHWGVVSITSFDGHCVRIDFPNREKAEEMFELLETRTALSSSQSVLSRED